MHENQAAYPCASGREDQRDHHLALTNLTSMLASQCVLWNSNWNRQSFVAGIEKLLTHEHEGLGLGVLDRSLVNSKIAWPPVEATSRTDRRVLHNANEAKQRGLSLVVWPHRWEHDKGPEELLAIEVQVTPVLWTGLYFHHLLLHCLLQCPCTIWIRSLSRTPRTARTARRSYRRSLCLL